ncbi:Dynamin family [Brachionus plicatilis]|uniref:Dynamin family n=1 Tax=Brachionus plicatilis TaxID=10195 RepID=A0A3M7T535_BRAPC|nr:Dynamin family [Brachionus plicatilis]
MNTSNIETDYETFVDQASKNLNEWNSRSSYYLSIIDDLIDSENENQLNDFKSALNQFVSQVKILVQKLGKRDFEIGVIGKEKAGKTAMINSWLQIDLLPSKEERCTYTTTEIRSCNSEEEQKYRIEYLSSDEFQNHTNQITQLIEKNNCDKSDQPSEKSIDSSLELLKEELNDIQKYEEVSKKFLNLPPEEHKYHSKEEMNERLKKAITLPEEARAVKRDKIIVALSHCDVALTKNHFEELLDKHYEKWREIGVPRDRIIPICSALSEKKESEKFKSINSRLKNIGIDDGFNRLKECVEHFILNMRYFKLKNKYENEANKYRSVTEKVYNIGFQKIPLNISDEELKQKALDEQKKNLDQWWTKTWMEILERFEIFFQTKIYCKKNPDDLGKANQFFSEFREKYKKMVDRMLANVNSMKKKRQEIIFQRVGRGQENEGHIEIRKELTQEVYKAIHDIPPILSRIMFDAISEILDWISRELWGIKQIREEIINDGPQSNTIMLKERIEALILRFARPAIDLFLSYPRYDNRDKTMSLYKQEISILDMYFFDEESNSFKMKGLKSFLADGTFSEANPDILDFDISK